MREIAFRPVETEEDVRRLCAIARVVWHETYDPLLPPGQVAYMLEKFQSPQAVGDQLDRQGYRYQMILCDGEEAGFIGYAPRYEGAEEMYLSKVYLLAAYRGSGAVRRAFELVEEETRREGLHRIRLTVNRGNEHAFQVYRHLGFEVEEDAVADIGGGYVMDDHIMVKRV